MGATAYLNEKEDKVQHSQDKEDVYDALLPKESSFWAPVRRWEKRMGFITPIKWENAFFFLMLHVSCLSYLIYFFYSGGKILLPTYIFGIVYYIYSGLGVSAGIHRHWSHRSFKVTTSTKIAMLIAYAAAGQVTIFQWVRDHRVHHRKSDTSADPHDITRGFFYAHIGWLMMARHPHVIAEGKKVDMNDITGDRMIVLFDRYFSILKLTWCFVVPTLVPVVFFGESIGAAIVPVLVRYLALLHGTWSINSFAHTFGSRPYNKNIRPTQSIIAHIMSSGEGLHNFHHTFPSDYKSTENSFFCFTTLVLQTLKTFGFIYDTKQVSQSYIRKCRNL